MKTLYALTIAAAVAMMPVGAWAETTPKTIREAVIYCTRTPGALLDPEKDDGSMISIEECVKQMLVI